MISGYPNPPSAYVKTWGTTGVSDNAIFAHKEAWEKYYNLMDYETYFSPLKSVLPQLDEVRLAASTEGWDGESAIPIHENTYSNAYSFLQSLPNNIAPPTVSAEPDGHITFEWYRSPHRTLSVSVSPEGKLHYAALVGIETNYGTAIFSHDVPKPIIGLINLVNAQ